MVVRHRGPKKIRDSGSQGKLVYFGVDARRNNRFSLLDSEKESGRGEYGHYGLRDTVLKSLSFLRVNALGKRHESVQRTLINRTPKSPLRKPLKHLPRIEAPLQRHIGRIFREELLKIR